MANSDTIDHEGEHLQQQQQWMKKKRQKHASWIVRREDEWVTGQQVHVIHACDHWRTAILHLPSLNSVMVECESHVHVAVHSMPDCHVQVNYTPISIVVMH